MSTNRLAFVWATLALYLMSSTAAASPWTRFRDAITAPVRVPAQAVQKFAKKPTLKNAIHLAGSPITAADQTVTNTMEGVNELIEQSPKVKKAITGKQIVVTVPIDGKGTSAPSPVSGPAPGTAGSKVKGTSAPPPVSGPAPGTAGSGSTGAGTGGPALVANYEYVIRAVIRAASPSGPTVVVLPTMRQGLKPAGPTATDRRIYRLRQIPVQKAAPPPVDIISRSKWKARDPILNDSSRSYERYTGKLEDILYGIVVHHSGNSNLHTMKEVQDLHIDKKGAADIRYHYGIDLQGRIFEGRPIDVKGAHVDGANTGKIGIVLLADLDEQWINFDEFWIDFNDDDLTPQMESALLKLIGHLNSQYPKIEFLGGHRECALDHRSCPGNLPMAKMDGWRSSTGLKKPYLQGTPGEATGAPPYPSDEGR
jgi:N-acetylmuramoyl-L-alanine amidase